jgi:SEC-C motif-containing protein
MRSRYSAYATQAIDYIVTTHDPATRDDVDREATEKWSREAEWLGLEVVSAEEQGDAAIVEFKARYKIGKSGETTHHERSRFRRVDGAWYFSDGDQVKPRPVVREAAKVGRNDPCPCGSGRKYKKCHGA